MGDIKTIALGLLLLLAMATAHTICYEIDEASERGTSSNSTSYIKDDENKEVYYEEQ